MEVVGYTSLLMGGALILVQVLAWALATLACQAAANHGLQTTRIAAGTTTAGTADARAVLAQVGLRLVSDPQVAATRTTLRSTLTIRGTVLRVLPFVSLPVTATVSGPTEPALTPALTP